MATGSPRLIVYPMVAWSQGMPDLLTTTAAPFDKHSSPLATSLLLPWGPSLPLRHLLHHRRCCATAIAGMAVLNQSWRIYIPLGAGWGQWSGKGDLSLMKDGGTPQPHHWISVPRTHGFQCQMVQLTLKSLFFNLRETISKQESFYCYASFKPC